MVDNFLFIKRLVLGLLLVVVVVVDGFSLSSPTPSSPVVLSDELRKEVQSQNPNEDNPPVYDFQQEKILQHMASDETLSLYPSLITHKHYETWSLDDVFPGLDFSDKFNTQHKFRSELRNAIRYDMISDTSIYRFNDEQQKENELAQNKQLIGYWKKEQDDDSSSSAANRMIMTTKVLQEYIGSNSPTGDEFMEKIGSLSKSTVSPHHWMDVVNVGCYQNFQVGMKENHFFHQDYGELDEPHSDNHHVFFGFPPSNNYVGTGVFPHLILLKYEQWRTGDSVAYEYTNNRVPKGDPDQPTPFEFNPNDHEDEKNRLLLEKYVVRPMYKPGQSEIITFRDVDVLHSSPDIQYRESVMRFG